MNAAITDPHGRPRCRSCAAAPEFLTYYDSEMAFPADDGHCLFKNCASKVFSQL